MSDTALAQTRESIAKKQAEHLTIQPSAWLARINGKAVHVSLLKEAAETYCKELCPDFTGYSVEPLYRLPIPVLSSLANENAELRTQLERTTETIESLTQSVDFYKRRVQALEAWQNKMRDPERTIVCDILANGHTLPESHAGERYKIERTTAGGGE